MSTIDGKRVNARRRGLLGDEPGAFATARFVRMSAQKVRRVADLVRGLPVDEALATLRFAPQAASEPIGKVVLSAAANAEENDKLERDELIVSRVLVDEGPTYRRYRARAYGRPGRRNKRTSHITVVVQPATVVTAASTGTSTGKGSGR